MARHSDLPLRGDAASRFLPWLVALMVFLISVAVAAAFVLDQVASSWDHDVAGTVTIQVSPVGGEGGEAKRRVGGVLADEGQAMPEAPVGGRRSSPNQQGAHGPMEEIACHGGVTGPPANGGVRGDKSS